VHQFALRARQTNEFDGIERLYIELDGVGATGATRCGVNECIPSGIGLTVGLVMIIPPCFKSVNKLRMQWLHFFVV
jgi:hypothetical protein